MKFSEDVKYLAKVGMEDRWYINQLIDTLLASKDRELELGELLQQEWRTCSVCNNSGLKKIWRSNHQEWCKLPIGQTSAASCLATWSGYYKDIFCNTYCPDCIGTIPSQYVNLILDSIVKD